VTWRDTVHQAINDNASGLASSTRIALVLASGTLSFSVFLLTFAVIWNPELVPAFSVAAGALGGMAGVSYTAQRAWNGKMASFTDRGMHDD
jgi:hypothetical protein